jgi:Na+-driven multidrug efflux pump
VLLNIIIGGTLTVLSLLFLDDILIMFGASEHTIAPARDFMHIIFAGTIINHLFWGFNEMIRASGYPQKTMGLMLLSVVLTCAFNALFLFVFKWGVRGSALATMLSQAVALCFSIAHFASPKSFLHFRRGIFRLRRRMVGKIVSIGIAPFLVNFTASIVIVFVNKALAANGGDLYSGGYGVMNRVVMLFIMICAGFNQGMQPIVGFNYGARQYDRVIKALKLTIFCAVVVMTVAFLAGELIPEQIARLFVKSSDPYADQLVAISAEAMRWVMMLFPIVGFQMVTSNFFQYIGKAPKAILLSLTRQLLFLLPLLLILPRTMGATGVWVSFPIADGVATAFAAVLLWHQLRAFKRAAL